MRFGFSRLAAFGAAVSMILISGTAEARRVAIDLGDSNFDFFGTQWDDPVKADVRNDGCFGGAVCSAEALPFAINYGAGTKTSLYVYENGFVTFDSAVDPARLNYGSLAGFGTDVIAPGYGDLISDEPTPERGYPFDNAEVSHTVGDADFTAPYDQADIAYDSIFNVTWNHLRAAVDGPDSFTTYQFQIQFLDATAFDPSAVAGDFDLSLNFGTTMPTGVLTGFKLGDYTITIDPSTITGQQTQDFVYSFRGGRLLGAPAPGVPEPATWAMMIAGFGLAGAAARSRSRVAARAIA